MKHNALQFQGLLAGLGLCVSALVAGCETESIDSSVEADTEFRPEIGVMLASHCDIDDPDTELESYVKTAFLKNSGIPIPDWIRPALSGIAYDLAIGEVRRQYDLIGPTRYRENSAKQVDALNAVFRARGLRAKAYLGCDFTTPTIDDALDEMRADGVQKYVLINKGAQYSAATGGEHMQDVLHYYEEHPNFRPEQFVMLKEFSSDSRFRKLLGDVLLRDIEKYFGDKPKSDVCVLLGSHGLPLAMVKSGDPATEQMLEVVDDIKERLSDYPVYHGFLNDDFFPGAEWTTPKAVDVAFEMRKASCPYVLLDGRLSFTTHHRATLYDMNVEAREILEDPDLQPTGEPHPLYTPAEVVFLDNFDGDEGLAELYADIAEEALRGEYPGLVDVTPGAEIPVR
jgi:protoheme ferro-lyase